MAKGQTKAESIEHWAALATGSNPLSVMRPIPYKTPGSKYGCDGIRIDGSPQFIDAVLSNLQGLIDGENCVTRLEVSRRVVECKAGYKSGMNAETGAEVCYLRLHMRSVEGSLSSSFFDRDLHDSTRRYADSIGAKNDERIFEAAKEQPDRFIFATAKP